VKVPTVQSVLALALSLQLSAAYAAAPVIGTVLAPGAFRLDNATLNGNATLLDGSLLETAAVASSVQLNSGARLLLAAGSRGRLFGDRLVLEQGASEIENAAGVRLVALGLTIQPDRETSTGRVVVDNARRVRVAATSGSLRVLNTNGQLVANLAPGVALAFEPQPGPSTVARVTGCLENRSGRYVLTDEVTNVTVEVAGSGVGKEAGNKVEVTGAMDPTATPVNDASQLVRAREVRRLAKGCGNATPVAAAAGAAGSAGAAGGAAGGAAVTTIAIVGGVAAAATVGGLAAAEKLPGQGPDRPSSR
jgi:hypothetical protein